MNKLRDLLSKTLVVGVIVLFIGVGVQPAFADKYNYDSNPIDEWVLENTNCYVVGFGFRCFRLFDDFSKIITFGSRSIDHGPKGASGKIYTRGDNGEWNYSGVFYGKFGLVTILPGYSEGWIGIKNFHGIALGSLWSGIIGGEGGFIGFAKHVKIGSKPS